MKRIALLLWTLFTAIMLGWLAWDYAHRPCADLPGSKLIVDPVRACEVKP